MKNGSTASFIAGISPDTFTTLLVVLTGLALLLLIGYGLSKRLLLLMGVRNMLRRPAHTLVLLGGLVLSTALITAAPGINDSLAYSASARQLASLGQLDEAVTGTFSQAQVASYLASIRAHAGIEAATALAENYQAARLLSPRTGFSRSNINVLAAPADFGRVFGQVRTADGQIASFADLRPGQIYLGMTLAQNFAARPGDHLTLSLGGQLTTVTVAGILASDITINASEIVFSGQEQLIMSLAQYQHMLGQAGQVNTLAITNRGHTGNQAVVSFLAALFGRAPTTLKNGLSSQPSYVVTHLDVIQPDLLRMAQATGLGSFNQGLGSQGTAQFNALLPALTLLMVGAGMLLLALLFILLCTERRVELGISRAIGLQRSHLIWAMLIEAGGYALLAALVGVPAGIGLVALELFVLSHIPLQTILGLKSGGSTFHLFLQVAISWNSLLDSLCLSILVVLLVVGGVAAWLSRLNIVSAMRDLASPARPPASLAQLLRACFSTGGKPMGNSRQRAGAFWALLQALFARGPLYLLTGVLLYKLADYWSLAWLSQGGLLLLVAGVGLLVTRLVSGLRVGTGVANRIGLSLIGLGWIMDGIQPGGPLFTLFQPASAGGRILVGGTSSIVSLNGSALALVLSSLALIAGAVVLVMANSDLLVYPCIAVFSHLPWVAPLSRLSLTYPLVSRFRTTVTISLLSLVAFLIMLVVTINLGAIQEADTASAAGGFQLSAAGQNLPASFPHLLQNNPILRGDFSQVSSMQTLAHASHYSRQMLLPGQPPQGLNDPIVAMDSTFLETTTMPIQARAQGYTSDRQVWSAVLTHPDYAVWYYEPAIHGLNPHSGTFQPFTVIARDQHGQTHHLLVIGLVSSATHWPDLFVSQATFTRLYGAPTVTTYLLRLGNGVSADQATRDLMGVYGLAYSLQIQSLVSTTASATVANLTLFFGCYLALGLLFGVVALGATMSRAVLERRQQIGMLRSLGFSRLLVLATLLVEAGFIITLSLGTGTALALWTAYRVTNSLYPDYPVPFLSLLLILLGCYVITFLATALPARHATRLRPAEALRYE